MSQPDTVESTDDLYDAVGCYASEDERLDYPLLRWLDSGTRVFVEPIAELVAERDERAPWELALDPENTPEALLPWLGQFVGAEFTDDIGEAQRRLSIVLPEVWQRCTLPALVLAVQRTLTGTKTVLVDQRYGGSAYRLKVRTLAVETPDEVLTRAAVMFHKPKGVLGPTTLASIYEAIVTQDYDDIAAKHADYDAVAAAYDDYTDLATTLP